MFDDSFLLDQKWKFTNTTFRRKLYLWFLSPFPPPPGPAVPFLKDTSTLDPHIIRQKSMWSLWLRWGWGWPRPAPPMPPLHLYSSPGMTQGARNSIFWLVGIPAIRTEKWKYTEMGFTISDTTNFHRILSNCVKWKVMWVYVIVYTVTLLLEPKLHFKISHQLTWPTKN